MSVKEIVYYGDSILRKKCKNVMISDDLSDLIDNMKDSMYEAEGIGLAAYLIGVNKNLFVVDISSTDDNEFPRVFINGKILESEGESVYSEGCLSLPKYSGVWVDKSFRGCGDVTVTPCGVFSFILTKSPFLIVNDLSPNCIFPSPSTM